MCILINMLPSNAVFFYPFSFFCISYDIKKSNHDNYELFVIILFWHCVVIYECRMMWIRSGRLLSSNMNMASQQSADNLTKRHIFPIFALHIIVHLFVTRWANMWKIQIYGAFSVEINQSANLHILYCKSVNTQYAADKLLDSFNFAIFTN